MGHYFGYKEKKEELKYFSLDDNYELIGKGDCKIEEENEKKSELLKKAEELIEQAKSLRNKAEELL